MAPKILKSDVRANDITINEFTKQKNEDAWRSLQRFAQPLMVVSFVGVLIQNIHQKYPAYGYDPLIEPALSFPLAALALASCVNFDADFNQVLSNYVYYFSKGLLVSIAIIASGPGGPSEFMFTKLNEGWLRDVFTGNLLLPEHGTGFRTMILFHTLNLFLNEYMVQFAYGQIS